MIQRAVSHFRSASWDIPPESAIPCFSILERDCEVELAHADEEVDATAADSKIAELLAVAPALLCRAFGRPSIPPREKSIYVLGFYRSDATRC